MSKKHVFIIGVLVMSVILSACGTAVAQGENQTPQVRTMNVNGSAQIYLEPDIAYISIGVHTENENASEAVASNNSQAEQIISALRQAGIPDPDMRTTNFSIYPSQQYDREGNLVGTRYIVENTVYVTLRSISGIGSVLEAAIDAGANNIYGIQFDVEDKAQAISQAREIAIANAQATAQEMAEAAGVTLGEIQNLSFYGGAPSPVMYDRAAEAAMGAGSVPISAGQLTISVDVNMVYEIH